LVACRSGYRVGYGYAAPTARALDLGCGTGTIYLATHGWDVTGVDMTPRALAIARHDATAASVSHVCYPAT
jgi:methylase of polypeptide subunit release factors